MIRHHREVLSREPMLHSRIYRRVAFTPLTDQDVCGLIPGYHPIYRDADPGLLQRIDEKAARGRMRSWAAFTQTAATICRARGEQRIDQPITDSALTQLGTAR